MIVDSCTWYMAVILLYQRLNLPACEQRPVTVIGAALNITTLAQLAQTLYHDRQAVLIHNCKLSLLKTDLQTLTGFGGDA